MAYLRKHVIKKKNFKQHFLLRKNLIFITNEKKINRNHNKQEKKKIQVLMIVKAKSSQVVNPWSQKKFKMKMKIKRKRK